jgi:hypothetical protein
MARMGVPTEARILGRKKNGTITPQHHRQVYRGDTGLRGIAMIGELHHLNVSFQEVPADLFHQTLNAFFVFIGDNEDLFLSQGP